MNKHLLITLSLISIPTIAQAQVVPDASLPAPSVVNIDNNVNTITGGTTADTNLFHSFDQFSLPTGSAAIFDNPANISNILGRVTGSSISEIDGLIGANGDANLFLINPNGMIFGENASLDIGGTFSAIAGEAIQFPEGEFSAVEPTNSILSINMPLGVQLGQQPGAVTVEGAGSGLFINEFFEADFSFSNIGLDNNSINLIAGEIELDGGNITARDTINIAAATGEVNFNQNHLDVTSASSLNDINLINESRLDASSASATEAGTINIYGANLNVADGSAVIAINANEGNPGAININTSESINLTGESSSDIFPSFISVDNAFDSTQPGGTIELETGNLTIDQGAIISASSFGDTAGGEININASQVDITSGGSFASSIIVEAGGTGDGGTINLRADDLNVNLGGSIGATNFGDGTGGTLNLEAQNIVFAEAENVDDETFPPLILADNLGEGTGGIINIESENLTIADSAQISVTTTGTGNGGTIDIDTDNLILTNSSPNSTEVTGVLSASGIEATEEPLGNGGNIIINSDNILLENDTIITARTLSSGAAGDVTINANNTTVKDEAVINTLAVGAGNGGALTIQTNSLNVTGGGQITTGTNNSGQGGNLSIAAQNVNVAGTSELGNSAILSTGIIGTGDSGDITITTNTLDITDGGTISASNFSTENANLEPGLGTPGTINIDANEINISENTDDPTGISTAVNNQSGGAINLTSDRITVTGDNASISGESLGAGDGGDIFITTNDLNLNQTGSITVSASAAGNAGNFNFVGDDITGDQGQIIAESQISGGGDITINSETINLNNNSLISTSVAESDGGGGDISITNDDFILLRNNSDIRANAFRGPGGNITIETNTLFQSANSDIDASSQFGLDGDVILTELQDRRIINTPVLPETQPSSQVLAASCPLADENSFANVGNGGIPNNDIVNQTYWLDTTPTNNNEFTTRSNSQSEPKAQLYDAETLVIKNGQIYLVANKKVSINSRPGC